MAQVYLQHLTKRRKSLPWFFGVMHSKPDSLYHNTITTKNSLNVKMPCNVAFERKFALNLFLRETDNPNYIPIIKYKILSLPAQVNIFFRSNKQAIMDNNSNCKKMQVL